MVQVIKGKTAEEWFNTFNTNKTANKKGEQYLDNDECKNAKKMSVGIFIVEKNMKLADFVSKNKPIFEFLGTEKQEETQKTDPKEAPENTETPPAQSNTLNDMLGILGFNSKPTARQLAARNELDNMSVNTLDKNNKLVKMTYKQARETLERIEAKYKDDKYLSTVVEDVDSKRHNRGVNIMIYCPPKVYKKLDPSKLPLEDRIEYESALEVAIAIEQRESVLFKQTGWQAHQKQDFSPVYGAGHLPID